MSANRNQKIARANSRMLRFYRKTIGGSFYVIWPIVGGGYDNTVLDLRLYDAHHLVRILVDTEISWRPASIPRVMGLCPTLGMISARHVVSMPVLSRHVLAICKAKMPRANQNTGTFYGILRFEEADA